MKRYLIVSVAVCTIIMGIMMQFVAQANNEDMDQYSDTVIVDRGYECFNLEVAQAQLADARAHGNRGEIIKAYRTVKNWEKLCKG